MTDEEVLALFVGLFSDFEDSRRLIAERPLLAHYTSIGALENILKTDEVWFSNPLFMNDLEEMRFGINEGTRLFLQSQMVESACASPARAATLRHAYTHYFNEFDQKQALDVYVFCLSQHDQKNNDGILSMWRAYGGQGNGAAIVFKTDFATFNAVSPLLFSKITYGSTGDRIAFLEKKLGEWCRVLGDAALPDAQLYLAAYQLFSVIKLFALTWKHDGFLEEREWRIIYMPERDPNRLLMKRGLHYIVSNRGVEPKLRLKIAPIPELSTAQWRFGDIVDRMILGPAVSSPLAKSSVIRMLQAINKPDFESRVIASTIPLRSS